MDPIWMVDVHVQAPFETRDKDECLGLAGISLGFNMYSVISTTFIYMVCYFLHRYNLRTKKRQSRRWGECGVDLKLLPDSKHVMVYNTERKQNLLEL